MRTYNKGTPLREASGKLIGQSVAGHVMMLSACKDRTPVPEATEGIEGVIVRKRSPIVRTCPASHPKIPCNVPEHKLEIR